MQNSTHVTVTFFRGWLVTSAATGIGLVLGILYVWSVIKGGIPMSWDWSNAEKALPYSIMAITFSFVMVPAGQLQDRYGPRVCVMLGGFLTGLGCVIAGLGGASVIAYVVGIGLVTGSGVGFGYSALTPAAIKWFPPEKTGFVAGIVVGGSGMAPVFLAPLTAWLLNFFSTTNDMGVVEPGVSNTMIVLGGIVWLVVACLRGFIYNPPPSYTPLSRKTATPGMLQNDYNWQEMLKTGRFWMLFFMYFSGASAGLVFISVAADLGKQALGHLAFLVVVALSLGNTLGRVLAGFISDKVGRELTLFGEFVCQAVVISLLYWLSGQGAVPVAVILVVVFLIGMNYGANLTIFPAACREYFGMRSFGLNYGCLFAAFGLAGLLMPLLNGLIKDITGKQDLSYMLIVVLLGLSAVVALISNSLRTSQAGVQNKE